MQEIAQQFKEEYTELLSRYKEQLTNAQIMSILQSVTRKQIGSRDNPERFRDLSYTPGFPIIDELNDKLNDTSDKRLEPILKKLKGLGVIKSWYYNGSYHAC